MKKTSARSLALFATTAVVAGLGITGSGANAAPAPAAGDPEILAKDLAGPLTTAVADDGTVYVTANNGGKLYKIAPDGTQSVVYKTKDGEVGGVSVDGDHVVFTITGAKQLVKHIVGDGEPRTLANEGAFERNKNPDKKTQYGFVGISKDCASQLPEDLGPATYTGIVESHPYATDIDGDTVYLADAAGNNIVSITGGEVSKVAVLPPTEVKATRDAAKALGLPDCVVGMKYSFEPVPTDVEMGPDGWLYVSSLPGGPEDGSLGAQGRVYKVNPANGKVVEVARGFVSTVNVAVADNGDVYVAQLFAGSIVRIPAGTDKVKAFAEVSMPAGLEWTADGLYATIDALKGNKAPKGKVAFIPFV